MTRGGADRDSGRVRFVLLRDGRSGDAKQEGCAADRAVKNVDLLWRAIRSALEGEGMRSPWVSVNSD